MVVNQKVTGRAMSMPAGIGLGLGVSALSTVVGCAAVAALVNGERLEMEGIGYGAMGVLMISAFLGAALAAALIRCRRMLVSMILGVAYFFCLLLVNGMLFGGSVTGAGVTSLVILSGSVCAGLLPDAGKGRKRSRHKKWHTG